MHPESKSLWAWSPTIPTPTQYVKVDERVLESRQLQNFAWVRENPS